MEGIGGKCEGKTRTKRRERNGSEVNCGTGGFVKILSRPSRKVPTYKKVAVSFRHTHRRKSEIAKGVEEGDGELRGQRGEKEMTVRAGRAGRKRRRPNHDQTSRR
jgi:hypothetical protein